MFALSETTLFPFGAKSDIETPYIHDKIVEELVDYRVLKYNLKLTILKYN